MDTRPFKSKEDEYDYMVKQAIDNQTNGFKDIAATIIKTILEIEDIEAQAAILSDVKTNILNYHAVQAEEASAKAESLKKTFEYLKSKLG